MKKPKFVCFNREFSSIVVVNAREVKMYRMKDGFMQTLVTDIFPENMNIQLFKMDRNGRRCYVTSTDGETKMIDIVTGVVLKTLFKKRLSKQEIVEGEVGESSESFIDEDSKKSDESEEDEYE